MEDAKKIEWIKEKKTKRNKFIDFVSGNYFLVSRKINFRFNLISIFDFLRFILGSIVIFWPLSIKILESTEKDKAFSALREHLPVLNDNAPYYIVLACLLIVIFNKTLDSWKKNKKIGKDFLEAETELAMRTSKIMAKLPIFSQNKGVGNLTSIRILLDCIRTRFKILSNDYINPYIEVSLIIFSKKQNSLVGSVVCRSNDVRPTDIERPAEDFIAYYVARTGKEKCVHNFNKGHPFKKEGISNKNAPYRSILFIPILQNLSGITKCIGVVTIDSSRPYEFYYGYDKRTVLTCDSYIVLIAKLLNLGNLAPIDIDLGN